MDFRRRLRGPDTLADTSVSARPLCDGPAECLLRLEPNGRMGAQVTAVGCLAALSHCFGQGIPRLSQPSWSPPSLGLLERDINTFGISVPILGPPLIPLEL